MNILVVLSRWFWLIALVLSCQHLRSSPGVRERLGRDQDFAREHMELRRRLTTILAVPWLVMGIGHVFGGVPTVWNYLRPQDLNPYVLAFFVSVVGVWAWTVIWVFLQGGARKAADHQLLVVYVFGKRKVMSEIQVKLITVFSIVGGCVGIILMATNTFQIPAVLDASIG